MLRFGTIRSFFLPVKNSRIFQENVLSLDGQIVDCQRYSTSRVHFAREPRPRLVQWGNFSRLLCRGNKPLEDKTIGNILAEAAERWPNHECIVSVHQNIRLTFSEILRRADRVAAGLIKLGMKQGDRIGIWGPNDVEWFIGMLAASRAGLIVVAINPAYQLEELKYCLQKVGVKAVISPGSFKTQNYPRMLLEAKETCPILEHIIIYSEEHATGTRRFSDIETLASRIEVERVAGQQEEISCQAGCNIQFTSGTTGTPKATLLSHRAVVNNSRLAANRSELSAGQRICLNVPFFHAFGLLKGQMGTLHSGATLVLESRSFDPAKSLEAIVRERCDVTCGTPTMWINLLNAHQRLGGPSITLSAGVTGGAPAPPELFKRIMESFHLDNMKTIYGLTETTGVAFQSLPGENRELAITTAGYLSEHVEVMVVDDNGEPVPFGSSGELWVRGYNIMMGYWDDEENTRKCLTEDGWLKTGDQFVLRRDGYGHIVGRKKDMLIRGGENIFPREIEDFLMTHPKVLEAHVIGAHDDVNGEEICACVRLRDDANVANITIDDLKNYCKGKIAHFKIPRYVEFVEEFPKTTSGKVKKFQLKEDMERKGAIPSPPV